MCRSIALSMQDRIVVTYNFRHQGEAYVYPSSDRLPSSRSERPVSRSVRPCYAFALQLTCGIPRSKSRCKGIKRASLIERQIVTLNFAEQRAQDLCRYRTRSVPNVSHPWRGPYTPPRRALKASARSYSPEKGLEAPLRYLLTESPASARRVGSPQSEVACLPAAQHCSTIHILVYSSRWHGLVLRYLRPFLLTRAHGERC